MQVIELKNAPELREILKATIGYKKHKCFLSVFPGGGVTINSYWDGGSRDEFALYDLVEKRTSKFPTNTHPFYDVARYKQQGDTETINIDSAGNILLKFVPENVCLIRYGTFCGKPATAHIYLNEANFNKLLKG